MVKVREDMTGWVMSEHGVPDSLLTVIKQVEDYIRPDGKHEAQWLCECGCEDHNQVIIRGWCIANGHTLSCGCWNRKRTSVANKKYNKYDLSGDYGIGWTSNTNKEFYFDLEDYDKIKNYCWCETTSRGMSRLVTGSNNKRIFMHQLLGFKGYDHINRNALDNRKENFRFCTTQQNTTNRSLTSRNASGFVGVGYNSQTNKWYAQIGVNYQQLYLGSFTDKDDAIRVRLNAEVKYFKEFAPQRHLFEQYEINTIQNDLDKENQTNDRTN